MLRAQVVVIARFKKTVGGPYISRVWNIGVWIWLISQQGEVDQSVGDQCVKFRHQLG